MLRKDGTLIKKTTEPTFEDVLEAFMVIYMLDHPTHVRAEEFMDKLMEYGKVAIEGKEVNTKIEFVR